MGYTITCDTCKQPSWAINIVELIDNHVDKNHMLKCVNCGAAGAYIHLKSKTQGDEEPWERWVKGVIRIDYKDEEGNLSTYHPYVFLHTHDGPKGKIDSVQISYYKDHRNLGGALKHGHGPGGTPVLDLPDIMNILQKLVGMGVISEF